MNCKSCNSENVQLLKEGEYATGWVCLSCGAGMVDYSSDTCCGNPNHTNVKFEQVNKVLVQRVACRSCKSLITGAVKRDKWFNTYPLFSNERHKEIEENKRACRNTLYEYINKIRTDIIERNNKRKLQEYEQDNIEWWNKYKAYLQTDTWKKKRQMVLERENWICQGCKVNKANHVHHETYQNLGDELLFQLIALCVDCHQKLHPEKQIS